MDTFHEVRAEAFNQNTSSSDANSFKGAVTMASTLAVTGAITATAGVTGNLTGNVVGSVTGAKSVEVVTAANTILAAESGTTYILNNATGFASTLPAPAAGLYFKFVIGATPPTSGNHTVVTASNATIIQGNIATVPVDDAGVRGDDEDTITFVASTALEGDYVELISDGTNYYASGLANVVEAITLTDAA